MKLVGTRIRIEVSEHKTEYFPEYCLEWKPWYGKSRQQWYGVDSNSSHHFGLALITARIDVGSLDQSNRTLEWAQKVIDYQEIHHKQHLEDNEHENTKKVSYVKYP